MIVVFDSPGTGKVVEFPSGRFHIVLVTSLQEAIRGDGILRNVNGGEVGRVVGYGVEAGSRCVWVDLREVRDG